MPSTEAPPGQPPRMLWWLIVTVLLMVAAHNATVREAGGLLAVSLYKAHLMSLGGWGGYWLDRALFPYARPHSYLEEETELPPELQTDDGYVVGMLQGASDYPTSMLRRAIIVAACLVCVGLGA